MLLKMLQSWRNLNSFLSGGVEVMPQRADSERGIPLSDNLTVKPSFHEMKRDVPIITRLDGDEKHANQATQDIRAEDVRYCSILKYRLSLLQRGKGDLIHDLRRENECP